MQKDRPLKIGKKETKEKIRAKTNDDMAEEAKLCFQYATELFKELYAEKKETDQ